MTEVRIVPTADEYAEGFHQCLDSVARERRHLAFLEAPPLDAVRGFMRSRTLGFTLEGVKRRARKLDGAYDDILAMALI